VTSSVGSPYIWLSPGDRRRSILPSSSRQRCVRTLAEGLVMKATRGASSVGHFGPNLVVSGRTWAMSRGVVLALALALLFPSYAAAVGNHHMTSCVTDGSLSVEVCVTMDYNIKWSPGYDMYMANALQYRTKYTRLDNSILFTSGDTFGGLGGNRCSGGWYQNSKHWIRTPTSGTTYADTTPWAGIYTTLAPNPSFGMHRVTATLTWRRGTQTYTTSAVVQLPSDGGWPKTSTC
jgi:hypothetical protein